MSRLAIVFGLLSLVFGLIFLIDCIRFRKQITAYVKYGLLCGLTLVVIDTTVLLQIPDFASVMPIHRLVALDTVAFVRLTVFTCMGMYCCSILNVNDFPAIRLLGRSEERNNLFRKPLFVFVGASVVLAVGYSVILFKLTSPQMSESLRLLSEAQSSRLGVGDRPSLLMALALLEFAFAEEIVFRLGMQNYVARQFRLHGRRYWIAIVLTTSFWSLAHANTLDPEWVKIAQVFPLGLLLGFSFQKYGTETCILVHGTFNLAMMFLSPLLITV